MTLKGSYIIDLVANVYINTDFTHTNLFPGFCCQCIIFFSFYLITLEIRVGFLLVLLLLLLLLLLLFLIQRLFFRGLLFNRDPRKRLMIPKYPCPWTNKKKRAGAFFYLFVKSRRFPRVCANLHVTRCYLQQPCASKRD